MHRSAGLVRNLIRFDRLGRERLLDIDYEEKREMKIRAFFYAVIGAGLAGLMPSVAAWARMPQMDMDQTFAFGRPATEADVTKIIHVQASDQMRLIFDSTNIQRGDVVKFVVENVGRAPHEFSIGDSAFRLEHQREMAQPMSAMAGMEHDDANVVSLKPRQTKTLIWRFDRLRTRSILFACYVPGHYEAGMYRRYEIPR